VAGSLRSDHRDVYVGGRYDLVEVNRKPVSHHEGLALGERPADRFLERLPVHLVRQEDHDDVRHLGGLRHGGDPQPVLLGLRPALRALVEPDDDVQPRVLEVQRVRVALAPIADDGNLLAAEEREVRVLVVVDLRWHPYGLLGRTPSG
jgi:hypothetical protein